jgi:hypothetical protein
MAAHLKSYGWQYTVVDEGWYLKNPESNGSPQDRDRHKQPGGDAPPALAEGIFTRGEIAAGEAAYQWLVQDGSSAVLIGQRVVDYAGAHADDPAVPEGLALTVRAIHYGSGEWRDDYKTAAALNTAVSKAASQLLHSRYPKSP